MGVGTKPMLNLENHNWDKTTTNEKPGLLPELINGGRKVAQNKYEVNSTYQLIQDNMSQK